MKQLLIVDDEPRLCQALKAFFEEKGFQVTTAATAQAALDAFRESPAEVALLDLRLPDGSGLDVLTRIKDQRPGLRVVMISGVADSQIIDEALQRGASSYLTKPFDFDRCFYAAMGIEVVDLSVVRPESAAVARVPAVLARQHHILPLRIQSEGVAVALADPLDTDRLAQVQQALGSPIIPLAVMGGDLTEAINACYPTEGRLSPSASQPKRTAPHWPVAPPRAFEADEQGLARLISELVQHAYVNRATDLHLGVDARGPWVRERIDGILCDVPCDPRLGECYPQLVSRLKVMANLNVAERRLPQDGRIWFELGANQLDLCISVLPTPHGENLAVRLLGPSRILRPDQLGMSEEQRHQVEALLAKPAGLVLVTGPVECGKSTTLYALLTALNTGRVNIVTVEDPIEHELSGVTQLQIQPKLGLTFAAGLRSALRHDPNVLMIGELDDQETASLAVGAALTGHLVLAGLHTNDAASAITRLLDSGIEPFVLCSVLSGIVSQRLPRRLCTQCRTGSNVSPAVLAPMGITAPGQTDETLKVWSARGCKQCRGTGYHGRTGLFEVLVIDHHLRALIIKRTSSSQIRQSAISRGMSSLWQSGWQAMQEGLTSLEELSRVLSADLR